MPAINNAPLFPGHIFISLPEDTPMNAIPVAYLVMRLGNLGYFGKLDSSNTACGFEAIPYADYIKGK